MAQQNGGRNSMKRPRPYDDHHNGMGNDVQNQCDGSRDPHRRRLSVGSTSIDALNSPHTDGSGVNVCPSRTDTGQSDRDIISEMSAKSSSAIGDNVKSLLATIIKRGIELENSRTAESTARKAFYHQRERSQRKISKSYAVGRESIDADRGAAEKDWRNKAAASQRQESDYELNCSQFFVSFLEYSLRVIHPALSALLKERDDAISRFKRDSSAQASKIYDLEERTKELESKLGQLAKSQTKAEADVGEKIDLTNAHVTRVEDLANTLKDSCTRGENAEEDIRRLQSKLEKLPDADGGLSALKQCVEGLEMSRQEDDDQNQNRFDGLRKDVEERQRQHQDNLASVQERVQAIEEALPTKMTRDEVCSQIQQLRPQANASPEVQQLAENFAPQPKRERASLPSERPLLQEWLPPQQHPQRQNFQEPTLNNIPVTVNGQRGFLVHRQARKQSPRGHGRPLPAQLGAQQQAEPGPVPIQAPTQRSNSEGAGSGLGIRDPNTPEHMKQQLPQHVPRMQPKTAPGAPDFNTLPSQQMQAQLGATIQRPGNTIQHVQRQQQQQQQYQVVVPASQEQLAQHVNRLTLEVRQQTVEWQQQRARLANLELATESRDRRHGDSFARLNAKIEENEGHVKAKMEEHDGRLNNQSNAIHNVYDQLLRTQEWVKYTVPSEQGRERADSG